MGAHRPYTRQFKEQAVKLVMGGQQEPSRTARELGMPHSTLLLWPKKAGWRKPEPDDGAAAISEDPAVLKAQIRELQRQLKTRGDGEGDFKKSDGLLRGPQDRRFAFVHERRGEFPVKLMCEVLNVTRGGYYAWRNRPASPRKRRRDELVERIRRAHQESRGTYAAARGSRRS